MDERKHESGLSRAASTAASLHGAVKTGKAAANIARGAAAGGPAGAMAAGLWQGRNVIAKVIAAAMVLILLPVLFLLMLPSLIFGEGGLDSAANGVMNDNAAIMSNLASAEATIETALREKHNQILEEIKHIGDALGSNCDYTIIDDFADSIVYESTLLISQFCASQSDYREINLTRLKQLIDGANGLFSYHVDITSEEEKDEVTGTTETYYHYTYTVEYARRYLFCG